MNIGRIGHEFYCLEKIDFDSKRSLLDYDLIFLNLNHIAEYYIDKNSFGYIEDKSIKTQSGFREVFLRRQHDIKEYISSGKILICTTPFYQELYSNNWGEEFYKPLMSLVSLDFDVIHSEGEKVKIYTNHKLGKIISKYADRVNYKGYFGKQIGITLATVKDDDNKVISTLIDDNLLFLPHFYELHEIEVELINDLVDYFFSQTNELQQPDWSEKYLLPEEKNVNDSITSIKHEIERLNYQLKEAESNLKSIINLKTLFTGTGDFLENQVERIFKEIGFEILKSENNRDDLILKFKELVAVVEIKGVGGSAAEKHAVQLDKWITEYHLRKEKRPKGILLVNPYKDIELEKRNDLGFPNQMLDFSIKREHCLINGIQLLGLYFTILENPEKKEELINSLFITSGVYKRFEDWKEFINVS